MKAFKYRFSSLLAYREAQLKVLRHGLQQSCEWLSLEEEKLRSLQQEKQQCEQGLMLVSTDPVLFRAALLFIRERYLACEQQQGVVEEVKQKVIKAEQAVEQMQARIRQLEKHCARELTAFEQERQRQEYFILDELWLQREQGRAEDDRECSDL